MYYDWHIFCCTNQRDSASNTPCCAQRGAEDLRAYLKESVKKISAASGKRIRVSSAGCLGRCALGPCMVIYPEGTWYACHSNADVDEVIASHLAEGKIVERLTLPERE